MIDLTELRKIAEERLKDAEALLAAGRYDGAIYLGGYVVELGLKRRICVTQDDAELIIESARKLLGAL